MASFFRVESAEVRRSIDLIRGDDGVTAPGNKVIFCSLSLSFAEVLSHFSNLGVEYKKIKALM